MWREITVLAPFVEIIISFLLNFLDIFCRKSTHREC